MWPSQRLASIGLKSWQGPVQARSRDRRGIRPIVTLLEERFLLSTLNLTVTTLSDPSGPNGTLSLRQAINAANADTTDSQMNIGFTPGLQGTIDLTTALPNLANNISINGNGEPLTVQRDAAAPDFSVFTVNSGETVSLSGITIAGGNATTTMGLGDVSGEGGGVYNAGSLTVTDSVFSNNSANIGPNNGGGGIYNAGSLIVTDSAFTNNSAPSGNGGGIDSFGALTVTDSTFTDNSADGGGGWGGGIMNAGPMTVTDSIFTGNSASWGGGIFNSDSAAYQAGTSSTVNSSTFTSNSAAGWGGAVANNDYNGTLSITASAFTGNSAGYGGGGIYNNAGTMVVTGSQFIDDSASPYWGGGGVCNGGYVGNTDCTATLTNCTMTANSGGNTYNVGTLVINQSDPTVSVTDAGGVYDATPYVAVATVNGNTSLEGITLTFDYQQLVNGVWTDLGANAPRNVGSYDVTANFAGSTDYTSASSPTVDFSIAPATATISVTALPGLVYNGSPQETASYSAIGVSGAIALPTSDFTDTTVHTAAGTSTDTWTFTDPNYASQSGAVTDTVGQANAMIVVTPTTGLVYNGSPQVTAAMSTLYGVTICDSIGFGIDHDLTVNATHTDAGTYADSWSFTDPTGNYAPQSGTMTDTIGQANVTVAVTPTNGTVYGTAPTFAGTITGQVAAGNPDNLLWTATLEENPFVFDGGNGYGLPSYSASGNLVVGTYTVQAGLVGNNLDNYSVTYVNSSLTVTPAPIIGHFTVANKVYDGTTSVGPIMTSQTTSLTGVLPGDSVNLMMWGAKFSSPNVGTWTVTPGATSTYLLSGDTVDYSLQSVDSTTATITPANATINILGYVAPYDGKAHTATGTVTGVYVVDLDTTVPPFGTIQQLPSSDLTISSTHTNAGVYTDTWTFSDPSGNYLPQSGTMIDAISKANAAVKVTPYNVTYDGQSHSATGSATGVNSTNLASDLTITSAHTNAGTYGDSWSFTDPNYVAQSGTMTDVISKANATVRVMGYNVNYNAVVHSAAGTVTGVNGALPNYDLIVSSSHTNAGVYGDTWTFNDPNYVTQSGKFTDVIGKANVTVKLAPYNVTYNGAWHVASGTAVGVNGQALPGLNLGYTWHINAGVYRDAWYFTDTTGNYSNASGLVTDIIGKANARIIVNAYNVLFDGGAHYSTGIVIGVYGQ